MLNIILYKYNLIKENDMNISGTCDCCGKEIEHELDHTNLTLLCEECAYDLEEEHDENEGIL